MTSPLFLKSPPLTERLLKAASYCLWIKAKQRPLCPYRVSDAAENVQFLTHPVRACACRPPISELVCVVSP